MDVIRKVLVLETNVVSCLIGEHMCIDSLEIDSVSGVCRDIESNKILGRLGRRELKLLSVFFENKDEVLTKKYLIDHVWGYKPVTDGALVTSVHKIRNLLREVSNKEYIYSISGVGYVFSLI